MTPISEQPAKGTLIEDLVRDVEEVAPQCRRCERYDEVSERGLCESCESFLAEDVALERYLDGEL